MGRMEQAVTKTAMGKVEQESKDNDEMGLTHWFMR
jgi:hypothetical protein